VKSYIFKVVVEEDQFEDGRPGYSAYCPALDELGAYTWGETREQALQRIQEAVKLVVDRLVEAGKPLPPDAALLEVESPAVVVTV